MSADYWGLPSLKNVNFFKGLLDAGIAASGADAFLLHVTTTPNVAYVVCDFSGYHEITYLFGHPFFDDNDMVFGGQQIELENVSIGINCIISWI